MNTISSSTSHSDPTVEEVSLHNYNKQDELEKGVGIIHEVVLENESDGSSIFGQDRHRLKTSLRQRHIQMLALVGVFGTGVFLSSGGVLS